MMLDVKVNAEKLRDKMTSPLKKVIPTVKDDSDELWKKPKSHHGAFNVNFENPWPSAQPPASSKIPDTMAVEREKDVPPEARRELKNSYEESSTSLMKCVMFVC